VVAFLSSVTALSGSALAVMIIWPGSLSLVHQALEHLVR
jgi:hypothetical protein